MKTPIPDDLDAIFDDAWTRLTRGVKDRRSAFHTPVVATLGSDGVRQRVMVLRAADRARRALRFHTDCRSAKVAHIGSGAVASVLGYDPGARIQLLLGGTLALADPEATEAAWQMSALTSRRAYLAAPGPGTPIDEPGSGLPEALLTRAPTGEEAAAGRANFAALAFVVERVEWLELTASGNRRALFTHTEGRWSATWLIP